MLFWIHFNYCITFKQKKSFRIKQASNIQHSLLKRIKGRVFSIINKIKKNLIILYLLLFILKKKLARQIFLHSVQYLPRGLQLAKLICFEQKYLSFL